MEEETIKKPQSAAFLYAQTLIFSLIVFVLFYVYTSWLNIPSELNKSAADTAIFLMGLSMILSGVCYFWNVFDTFIKYRKYLGMVGWAYAITHVALSYSTLINLFTLEYWEAGLMWPALNGYLATVIFTIMALVSNSFMATKLGPYWRMVLRAGYIAIIFVMAHVVLLRLERWSIWIENGMQTPPSASLIVTIFMVLVLVMRIALWWSTSRKKIKKEIEPIKTPLDETKLV